MTHTRSGGHPAAPLPSRIHAHPSMEGTTMAEQKPKDPGAGVQQATQDAHEARIAVPDAPKVDARLDNRSGSDRPPLETWPAKPQQIDGPDVTTQVEFTRKVLADRDAAGVGDRKGAYSPGPHGLSDESVREASGKVDGPVLYGTESLTEGDLGGHPAAK